MRIYENIENTIPKIKEGTIKLGSNTCSEKSIDVNSLNFIFDGKDVLPVMGEFHFSRLNYEYWKESILKMKQCGINIISTYIFWIHHEEEKDVFNWDESRNLRLFIKLCKELDMKLVLRLGPWAHGEARNGGFPDWLVKEIPKPIIRSNDFYYLSRVEMFFKEIFKQVEGFFFKEGGPVIAIQVENEYKGSKEHLLKLKEIILNIGFDVPFYTATAWSSRGYSDIPSGEMIPAFGGYPDAPWATNTEKLHRKEQYIFTDIKNDEVIGNDLETDSVVLGSIDMNLYPYITCELGAGVQATKHRRPKIEPKDVVSMAYTKVGSGANLLGYYMFHGGTNPYGKYFYLNETKDTGYPNDLPKMTYDFQAPIGEYAILKDSYNEYKMFHYFLNNFGGNIAVSKTIIPKKDSEVRYALRINKNSGFIFVNNYQRFTKLNEIQDVTFEFDIENEKIKFPSKPMNIPSEEFFVLPFNQDLDGIRLNYSTTQLILRLEEYNEITYFFRSIDGIFEEYSFDKDVEIINGNTEYIEDKKIVKNINLGINCAFKVANSNTKINIVTLSNSDALNLWNLDFNNKKRIILTENTVLSDGKNIEIIGTENIVVYKSDFLDEFKGLEKINSNQYSKEYSLLNDQQDEVDLEVRSIEEGGYSFEIDKELILSNSDCVIEINYIGESAGIFVGDKLIADNFYIDGIWQLGLRHIAKELGEMNKFIVKINPLEKNDDIYLEEWPNFDKNSIRTLKKVVIKKNNRIIL